MELSAEENREFDEHIVQIGTIVMPTHDEYVRCARSFAPPDQGSTLTTERRTLTGDTAVNTGEV